MNCIHSIYEWLLPQLKLTTAITDLRDNVQVQSMDLRTNSTMLMVGVRVAKITSRVCLDDSVLASKAARHSNTSRTLSTNPGWRGSRS